MLTINIIRRKPSDSVTYSPVDEARKSRKTEEINTIGAIPHYQAGRHNAPLSNAPGGI